MRPRGLKCRIILFRIKVGVVARRQRPKQIARDLYMKEKKRVFRKKSIFVAHYYKAKSPSVEVYGGKRCHLH